MCTKSKFHNYSGAQIHKKNSRVSRVITHFWNWLSTQYTTDGKLTVEKQPQEGICQLLWDCSSHVMLCSWRAERWSLLSLARSQLCSLCILHHLLGKSQDGVDGPGNDAWGGADPSSHFIYLDWLLYNKNLSSSESVKRRAANPTRVTCKKAPFNQSGLWSTFKRSGLEMIGNDR